MTVQVTSYNHLLVNLIPTVKELSLTPTLNGPVVGYFIEFFLDKEFSDRRRHNHVRRYIDPESTATLSQASMKRDFFKLISIKDIPNNCERGVFTTYSEFYYLAQKVLTN